MVITYFSLEWYNCGCHCGDDVSSTILIVSSGKKRITYGELNSRGDVLSQQDGPLQASSSRAFFDNLDKIITSWEGRQDFCVPVCDGSCWKITIHLANRKIYRFKGTVEYPPCGREIEQGLLRLCEEAGVRAPQLFGCC